MPFQPQVDQGLVIGNVTYHIAEHPAAPAMPYGQEGRQAIVYQLVAQDGAGQALKVFKPRYRLPALAGLADRIAPFAALPGLQVCRRTVLTPQRHAALLRQHPDLTYAVLMPWVEGPTWMEVLLQRQPLPPEQSLLLARSLAEILATMEQNGLAHCDLSGPNLLLPGLLPSPAQGERLGGEGGVALVDIEQLYGPDLRRPELLPGGSPGYAHKTAPDGLWGSTADRFAGAVLLGEMVGWCDERVREASWGENYFDPQEMQRESERFQTLVGVLEQRWGTEVAGLFERAWRSEVLADCATFGEWLVVLPEEVPVPVSPRPLADEGPEEKAKAGEDTLKMLTDLARRLEEQGNIAGAVEVYRQAQAMAPAGSGLARELALIVQDLEGKQGETAMPEPRPLPVEEVVGTGAPVRPPEEEVVLPEPQPWPEERMAVEAETATPPPELPLGEGTEVEPVAFTPETALEREMALIAQEVGAKPQEEVPSPELQPPVAEAEAEVATPPAGEEVDLDRLFDEGLAAYERGEWAEARELLGEVTRQRPGYARGGYETRALLAEAEKRLAPPHRKRVPGWAWVVGGLALVIGFVMYSGYQKQRAMVVEQMKTTVLAQYQATATAQSQSALALISISGPGVNWSPALEPGGSILFTSDRDGKREIYRMTSSGEVVQVTNTPGAGESWAAVPEPGGSILFTSDRDGEREIYRMTSSGEVVRVTNTPGAGESWVAVPEPGGSILFTSDRDGKREIYRMTSSGEVVRVTNTPGAGESWAVVPEPGGSILFTSDRGGKREVYRMASSGEVVRVTNTPGAGESWAAVPEPGGSILFTSNRDGKQEVYRMASSGGAIRVTNTPGTSESWAAVPEPGGSILFTSDRDGKREVYRMASSGEVARVTHAPAADESWLAPSEWEN